MADTSHFASCQKSMKWLKRTTTWRFIITAFSLVINSMMYFLNMFKQATFDWSPGNTFLSFIFLIASLVLGAYILYLSGSAAAYPEKPKILGILVAVLVLARLTNIVLNVFSFLILLWATQFFQVKKAKWLTEQEGYPYFSERFEEQKVSNEYIPPYSLHDPQPACDNAVQLPEGNDFTVQMPAVMPDIPEMPGIPELPAEEEL